MRYRVTGPYGHHIGNFSYSDLPAQIRDVIDCGNLLTDKWFLSDLQIVVVRETNHMPPDDDVVRKLGDLAMRVAFSSMVPLPPGSINEATYGPHTEFSDSYQSLIREAIHLAEIMGDSAIREAALEPYAPLHNNRLAAKLAAAACDVGASKVCLEMICDLR